MVLEKAAQELVVPCAASSHNWDNEVPEFESVGYAFAYNQRTDEGCTHSIHEWLYNFNGRMDQSMHSIGMM